MLVMGERVGVEKGPVDGFPSSLINIRRSPASQTIVISNPGPGLFKAWLR